MPGSVLIALGLIGMIVLIFSGLPIFVAIGLAGAFGTLMFVQPSAFMASGYLIYGSLWKIGLLATPGFILMGAIFFECGFGKDLFNTANKWLGRLPGGLLIASVAMGAMFGFICGSAMAGLATIGTIAIPEVEQRGYDMKLSLGTFAISGTLSVLIPPSLLMIIYAVLAEVSLSDLFFAGLIPGILLGLFIAAYIVFRTTVNRNLCPPAPRVSWRERLNSLVGIIPVLLTFFIVLGGIYKGVWSVIEAASAGAVLAVVFSVIYGRFTWARFRASLYTTFRICSMVFTIMISATFLNYFVFVSKFDEILVSLVTAFKLPNWAVIFAILLTMSIMGCIFDMMALLLLSIPVFLPVAISVGYSPIWFGIILIIAAELALITPPVGLNLYILKDMAPKGVTTMDIAKGALPLVIVVWVLFALLTLFPQIALWLPSVMKAS